MDQGLLLAKVLNTKPLQDVWKKAEMAEIAAVAFEKVQGTLAWWQKAKHRKTKLDGITTFLMDATNQTNNICTVVNIQYIMFLLL